MSWDFTGVSWIGVVVAAVVGLVIGFVWYAPQVFGRRWAESAGIEMPTPGSVGPMVYVLSVASVLVTAYALALLVKATGAASIVDGAVLGFVVWLGFVATWTLNGVTFEKKPWMYWYLNAGQGLLSLLVMGAILGYVK